MPLSIFQGAPAPREGEPLYTQEDHDWFIALAEERRDTCPSCGLLKSVCRSPDYQFAFQVHEDQCHATQVLSAHQQTPEWAQKHDDTRRATQLYVRFREGHTPPLEVGLELEDEDSADVDAAEVPVVSVFGNPAREVGSE